MGPGQGVGLIVDGHEVVQRDAGVALGGGELGVAEEFLDGAEVGAIAEQMGGVGVAEGVGVEAGVAVGEEAVFFDEQLDAAGGETGAAAVDEQSRLFRRADGKVMVERFGGFRGVGHEAFLAALAADAEPAFGAVEVFEVEADALADAEAAAVEEFEDGVVAFGLVLFHDGDHLLFGGNGGEGLGEFGGEQELSGVVGAPAHLEGVLQQAADGGDLFAEGGGVLLVAVEFGEPAAEVGQIDGFEVGGGAEVGGESGEGDAVGFDGFGRGVGTGERDEVFGSGLFEGDHAGTGARYSSRAAAARRQTSAWRAFLSLRWALRVGSSRAGRRSKVMLAG